jgi:hypothetical protein
MANFGLVKYQSACVCVTLCLLWDKVALYVLSFLSFSYFLFLILVC